jgi:hypothetical protein
MIGGSDAFISTTTLSMPQPCRALSDGVDLGVPGLDGRGAHQVRHLIDPRAQLRRTMEVDAPKNNAGAGRRWFQRQGDGFASMERTAVDRDFPR